MYWNPYGYVGGNPVNYVDPTGEFPWLLLGAALKWGFIAFAGAFAIDAGTQYLDDGHVNWGGSLRRAGEWGLSVGIGTFTGGLIAPHLAAGTMTLGRAALISGAVDTTWSLGYELGVHRNDFGTALFNTAFGSILGEAGALAKPIARGLSGTWLGRGARWAGQQVGSGLDSVITFSQRHIDFNAVGSGPFPILRRHSPTTRIVGDAGLFLERLDGSKRIVADTILSDPNMEIVIPRSVLRELRLGRIFAGGRAGQWSRRQLRRFVTSRARIRIVSDPALPVGYEQLLSRKFGLSDLQLMLTAQNMSLPIVTGNNAIVNQIRNHAGRYSILGGVPIHVLEQDFINASQLRSLVP